MALQEKIFLNRDNAIKLGLTADGAPISASTLTRVVVKLTNGAGTVTTFDSNVDPAAFDFTTETAQVSDTVTGILVIKLQDAAAPPAAATVARRRSRGPLEHESIRPSQWVANVFRVPDRRLEEAPKPCRRSRRRHSYPKSTRQSARWGCGPA